LVNNTNDTVSAGAGGAHVSGPPQQVERLMGIGLAVFVGVAIVVILLFWAKKKIERQ
jgi:hypothetical protein